MDVERTIDEIEQLQEMFEAPDIRPLSASDISAANRRHDEMLAHSPWFRLWQRYGVCCRTESPQCFDWGNRGAKTAQKFETFQSGPPVNGASVKSNSASNPVIFEETDMDRVISTKDLKSKLDQKQLTVVETLAPERYREAHIPGALNISPERVKELAPQLLPNKDAEIVTYCTNTH